MSLFNLNIHSSPKKEIKLKELRKSSNNFQVNNNRIKRTKFESEMDSLSIFKIY